METNNSSQARLLYNPQLQSAEMVEKLFVVRNKQFSFLLDSILREKENSIPQHYLIVGQRGMGKTTILKRMEIELHKEQYRQRFIPLLFREEQYRVRDLAEFWLNSLDALADSLEYEKYPSETVNKIDRAIQELSKKEAKETSDEAFKFLMSICLDLHRRPVLLIDNIDIVFSGLDDKGHDKKEQWALRKLLSENGAPIVMSGGVTATDDVAEYKMPFYDFFIIQHLNKLNFKEFMALLNNLAMVTNSDPSVFSAIQQNISRQKALLELTGGSPRVTVMLFDQIAKGFTSNINDDLNILADAITPLYKAKFEELPPQQRAIIDAIALNWDAISLRKLAIETRMKNNQLSPQLKRLIDDGWIENTPAYKSKGNAYFISERFFNIYYLIRNSSRRHKDKIYCLSRFLDHFYGKDELERISDTLLKQDICNPDQMRLQLALSISKTVRPSKRRKIKEKTFEAFLDNEELRLEFDFPEKYYLLHKGELLLNDRKYDEANDCFNRVINSDSDSKCAWCLKGRGFLESKNHEEALACFNEFVEKNPQEACGWFKKGEVLLEMNESNDAVVNFDKALELNPQNGIVWMKKGEAFSRMDKYDEALICFDKVIQLNRKFEPAYFFKGLTLIDLQRYEDAVICFNKCLKMNKTEKAFRLEKGRALGYLQRSEEAIECFDAILKSDRDFLPAWDLKGDELGKIEQYDKAIACFNEGIRIDPENANYHYKKGACFLSKGFFEKAIDSFNNAIELDPLGEFYWASKGVALDCLYRHEEAIDCYDRAIEINPEIDFWDNKGMSLFCLNRYKEAINCFEQSIRLSPDNMNSWKFKGDCFQELQSYKEAIVCYDKAIELNPNMPVFWNTKGYTLTDLEEYEEAIICFDKAIELDPNYDSAMANKGFALIELKKYEEAAEMYEQSISSNPNNSFALFGLIFIYRDKLNKKERAFELFNSIKMQDDKLPSRYFLNKSLFELYDQNKGLGKESLLQAFDILEKEDKLAIVANEHWWIKFGSVTLKLGYGTWLLDILQDRGYDIVLSPYHAAIQMLVIEQKDNTDSAETYIKNRAVEIGDPAKIIIEKIRKYMD